MTQVREAILSVLDDVEDELVDWMLFYVYSRSDNVDRMEYKVLVQMLDEVNKKSERLSSAKPKRPESSSPEKIKQHNPPKQESVQEDERYSSDEDNDMMVNDIKDLLPHKQSDYEDSPRQKIADLKGLDDSDRLD